MKTTKDRRMESLEERGGKKRKWKEK